MSKRFTHTLSISFGLILIAVLLAIGGCKARASMIEDRSASVVLITCYNAAFLPESIGTGTVISTYQVLTAAHVVDTCVGGMTVEYRDKDNKYLAQLQWMGEGGREGIDVAIITTSVPEDVRAIPLSRQSPVLGQSVSTIGFPRGLPWVYADGVIAATHSVDPVSLVDIMATHGSSGSAVVDSKGQIIGVISRGLLDPDTRQFLGLVVMTNIAGIRQNFPEDLR